MIRELLLSVLVAAPTTVGIMSQANEEPPSDVKIDLKAVFGSGCPRGTAAVAMNGRNDALTVSYGGFTVVSGPHVDLKESRKNCQLAIAINSPGGYTVAIKGSDFRGYGNLHDGARGNFSVTYYTQAQTNDVKQEQKFSGPYDDNWTVRTEIEDHKLAWGTCGGQSILNVKQVLDITASPGVNQKNLLTMDSTDQSSASSFQLSWKRC